MNANEKETTLTRAGSAATRKLVLTAMFTCLAFVLNTFVYFPAMAPFQHFVNVLCWPPRWWGRGTAAPRASSAA